MGRNNKETQLCAFCGDKPAVTDDHIPPKGIFPKPRPRNLITVPACFACNKGTSTLDEEFKLYLSFAVGVDSEQSRALWKEGAFRTLKHNNRLKYQIVSSASPIKLSADNKILETIMIQCPKAAHDQILEKIVRGLYFHHFQEVLGDQVLVDIRLLGTLSPEIQAMTQEMIAGCVGEGQFNYWYGRDPENPLASLWILTFYGRHPVIIFTLPKPEPAAAQ